MKPTTPYLRFKIHLRLEAHRAMCAECRAADYATGYCLEGYKRWEAYMSTRDNSDRARRLSVEAMRATGMDV